MTIRFTSEKVSRHSQFSQQRANFVPVLLDASTGPASASLYTEDLFRAYVLMVCHNKARHLDHAPAEEHLHHLLHDGQQPCQVIQGLGIRVWGFKGFR